MAKEKKPKTCKLCDKERYANTSWCAFHYQQRELEKKLKKKEREEKKAIDKVKKKTEKDLKKLIHKRVWKLMSEYIRSKDADQYGFNYCYTCGAKKHWREFHCGHYKHDRLDFDERNLKQQCLTKDSKIRMVDGSYKNINKVSVGDLIIAFDKKTFDYKVGEIEHISSFTPEILYEVKLENGDKFYATADHKIVANNKWVKIEDILDNFNNLDIKEL